MKTKYFITSFILISLITGLTIVASQIFAQEDNIQYPIESLGNCKDKDDCKLYCDNSNNTESCLNFAETNNLMSDKELKEAKKFLAAGEIGPGGCDGKDECEEYCNDIEHIDECVNYAEKNNLMPAEELMEAKKIQEAIKRGVKPPPCKNKEQCDVYCEEPDHMEECITFGVEAGFIQGKELEDAQKMLQAIKRGVNPPPCKGRDACDKYCSEPDNMETCMNFAIEAGMMSEEEKTNAQGMLKALKSGIKPPPCKGKDECDNYCQEEGHMEECINFSVAAGMMSEEEAEMAKKTGGKGPGGCKGEKECNDFCNNPDNQEICFNFARDNGMIPEEDLKRMEEGKEQMKQSLEQAPEEVLNCLKTEMGEDMVEKMKNGFMPPKDVGEKMQGCFQKMGPPQESGSPEGGPGAGGMMPPAGQIGPGGCKNEEECKSYCESNPQECQNFQGPANQFPENQMQPGQPCQGENCQYGPPPGTQPYQPGEQQPGQQPQPCQGENCQQYAPGTQPGQPVEQMPPQPCQGENCQYGPPPGTQPYQPGEQPPPPSTEPGAGGGLTPGDPVPPAPQIEQQPPMPQPPPPAEQQTPPPSNEPLTPGSILRAIIRFFTNW